MDTEVDKQLDSMSDPEAEALPSKTGIGNARLASVLFETTFGQERAKKLPPPPARTSLQIALSD
ncbi:hypothetical protein [Microbacterium sp.]|uniref:hypothetical protein n=1 Tax=Microbacterium sp. TaxID=51671 RepID=UPI003A94CDB5